MIRMTELSEVTAAAVRKLKDSTIQTELSTVLDLYNVFCFFVPNFSEVRAPLHKKLRTDQPTTVRIPYSGRKGCSIKPEDTTDMSPILAHQRDTRQYTVLILVYNS